jgi:uncharacterized protein (TIGR02996 family)
MHVAARRDGLMDATLASLLRACKDEPFDDARRLVLADWLEEHGQPDRAEFVRLQLATHDLWGDEPEGVVQLVRCKQLMNANAERWLGPARGWYAGADLELGLVRITATARQLLEHPPTDLPADVAPWLEELTISNDPDGFDDVLVSSMLGLFSSLEASGHFTDPRRKMGERGLGLLLSNPALAGVRALRLAWNRIDRACAEALARCDHLAGLRSFDLFNNPLGDAGAAALAEAPWLSGLTHLNLGATHLGADGLAATFRSPHLGALTQLQLSQTRFDKRAMRALAESPRLASLTQLYLWDCEAVEPAVPMALTHSPYLQPVKLDLTGFALGEEGGAALARSRLLGRIENLKLNHNRLTEAASAALLGNERLAGLDFLQLWDRIGDAGCEAFASAGHFGRLRQVSFRSAGIGPKGAAALGRASSLGGLTALCLDNNPIGPAVRPLVEGAGLPRLQSLSLAKTGLQARGVRALVGSATAERLLRLNLGENRLTDAAAAALARLGHGARLTALFLNDNRIGPAGAACLAECPGLADLLLLSLSENRIGDRGAEAIVRSSRLPRLSDLDVGKNGLTHAGARLLLDWPRRAAMTGLCID